MTSKEEVAIWASAVDLHSRNREKEALDMFSKISSYSKVLFNMGAIYASSEDFENADIFLGKSLQLDKYCAVAYFQKGLALFMLFEYDIAVRCYQFCFDVSA